MECENVFNNSNKFIDGIYYDRIKCQNFFDKKFSE